jgi:hypothetical protein
VTSGSDTIFDTWNSREIDTFAVMAFPSGQTAPPMAELRERDRPGFRYHLKVHSFRTLTVILAWALVVAAFYQKPEWLTAAQRVMQRGIEALGDAVPPPWGPRIEFVFREIGGLIWLQITLVVLALRFALSTIAVTWRLMLRRDREPLA